MKPSKILLSCFFILLYVSNPVLGQEVKFPWPEGKKMALSLSFDDARASNPTHGIPLLDQYGIRATFFVVPQSVQNNLEGWRKAVASGHEMANHSIVHPCSGNFVWSRNKALENYTLDKMRTELLQANFEIENLLGVKPTVYAYPCGQMYVGRGPYAQSLVPLISELFVAGRGWLAEAPVDPLYTDMAQLTGIEMDNKSFDQIKAYIDQAAANGQWLVLAGHETNDSGRQTTYLETLRQLAAYVNNPENGIWVAPIGEIADYVQATRKAMADTVNMPQLVRAAADGTLHLTAENGRGVGPRIEYMPDWRAFGWFTGKDQVEWEVDAPHSGTYQAVMEWSVSDEESGKGFVFESSTDGIKGRVERSGSWETFKTLSIGKLKLQGGYNKLVFRPEEDFGSVGALLDLKQITLIPLF
ncbi:polysaccharide deacetylase family protein [Lunatimonas lonarensis]|uniref:Polysaccharide deacetylase family protein n=1 Tax=Lunatimonas lonarensis TaxID=1232681 RepID=R7ZUV2_9BACT|nr:polysaccharide deacetylase family protein [Lunatimonas lonarensis]EON77925.1 polysaccharide deacetylase family protein [Lunatimonas lonarensis]